MWTVKSGSPPRSGISSKPSCWRMRKISLGSSFSPRIRCTSERCSATGARSTCRTITSIVPLLSLPPADFRISSATRSHEATVDSKSAPRTLANCGRIKPCGLDKNVPRLRRDHGVESAHDAGKTDRFHRIGDDQIFWRKLAFYPIEGFEGLAAESASHQNLAAFEQIEVVHVCRLAHFPQRVVGGVGGVIDGTLLHEHQSLGDVSGRWLDFNIANNASGVASAARLICDFYAEVCTAVRSWQTGFDGSQGQVIER